MRRVRKALAASLGSLERILSLAPYVERKEKTHEEGEPGIIAQWL